MEYLIKKRSLCWYCANACDCNKCTISIGQEPKCVKKSPYGFIISCDNFVQDVPFPMTKQEFAEKYLLSYNAVLAKYYKLTKTNSFKDFLKLIYYVGENKLFYKNIMEIIRLNRANIIRDIDFIEKFYSAFHTLDYNQKNFKIYYTFLNDAYDYLQREYTNYGHIKGRYSYRKIKQECKDFEDEKEGYSTNC